MSATVAGTIFRFRPTSSYTTLWDVTGVRLPSSSCTASSRNSGGYAGRVLGTSNTILPRLRGASRQVSGKPGELQGGPSLSQRFDDRMVAAGKLEFPDTTKLLAGAAAEELRGRLRSSQRPSARPTPSRPLRSWHRRSRRSSCPCSAGQRDGGRARLARRKPREELVREPVGAKVRRRAGRRDRDRLDRRAVTAGCGVMARRRHLTLDDLPPARSGSAITRRQGTSGDSAGDGRYCSAGRPVALKTPGTAWDEMNMARDGSADR
jgi:hypothetical protein